MKLALALVCAFATPAFAGFTMTFSGDPHPGMHRETWTDNAIPARIRLVQIDLTSSEIAAYATQESDRGITTTEFATRKNAQLAINGDAFAVNGYVPRGLAMGASNPWSQTADNTQTATFLFRREGERTVADIIPPEAVITPMDLPEGTEGVISGRPLLVRQSAAVTQFDCNDSTSMPCQPAPRTAVAISPDGRTLWIAVVDGWQSGSIGVTCPQLAEFLVARGAGMALALDGGSSSTLYLDGDVISNPSDGVERTVANHLAFKYGQLPKGQMYGLVCKHNVIGCANDPPRKISGAQVFLDDTRMQTTDSTGVFDFLGVTPRLACVTVKKTGYQTVKQCRQVVAGEITYNSVALWEGMDPPDAGVRKDAAVYPDATTAGDAQTSDGGNGYMDPGGGCCESGGGDRGTVPLLVLVAFFLRRRRGTND
ncbi:MAG TPA: phosphodiester glycosidase family protein [Kofleriaceae bacterium]|nr:phosphodiester glycosidase family protein [Kofleriaceae bacterium]